MDGGVRGHGRDRRRRGRASHRGGPLRLGGFLRTRRVAACRWRQSRAGRSVAAMLTRDDSAPAIDARDIVKVFGEGDTEVRALDGVDLVVERGEMVAIMGPSGSGKSTLLHIVGALETPDRGHRRGRRPALRRSPRQGPHAPAARPHRVRLPVLQPAAVADRGGERPAAGADRAPRRRRYARARPDAARARRPRRPRDAHARRAVGRPAAARRRSPAPCCSPPELVLADEPTGNLDTRSGRDVLRALRDLNQAEGRTILMVTHDPRPPRWPTASCSCATAQVAGEVAGGSTQRRDRLLRDARAGRVRAGRGVRSRPCARSTPSRSDSSGAGRCARCSPRSASCSASGWCSASCCWSARSATPSTT